MNWSKKFLESVKEMDEVVEFYRLSGTIDYLLKVLVPSIEKFDEFYKKTDRKNRSIRCYNKFFHGRDKTNKQSSSRLYLMNNKFFEWAGVTAAILYSLFVALNIGIEFIGFSLLLISAILIGIWAYTGKHKGILLLQFFYAAAGIIGMIRWF